jgi:hypothetical protein
MLDDQLKRAMSKKSLAQALKFSWEKVGAKLLRFSRGKK